MSSSSTSAKPALRKPRFTKVDQMKPQTSGLTLTVKVLSSDPIPNKRPPPRSLPLRAPRHGTITQLSECLVGDDTGTIIFTARNEQVDLMKPGTTVILRNSKIDMFKGQMRLAVDKWGRIEVTEPASFTVNEDNNMSMIEYELVGSEDA